MRTTVRYGPDLIFDAKFPSKFLFPSRHKAILAPFSQLSLLWLFLAKALNFSLPKQKRINLNESLINRRKKREMLRLSRNFRRLSCSARLEKRGKNPETSRFNAVLRGNAGESDYPIPVSRKPLKTKISEQIIFCLFETLFKIIVAIWLGFNWCFRFFRHIFHETNPAFLKDKNWLIWPILTVDILMHSPDLIWLPSDSKFVLFGLAIA